jgi:predicted cobalt transporter CbtA
MVRTLLIRGMLVGIVAGLIAFGFSKVFGEPQVDRAIAFETQMDEAKAKAHMDMSNGMDMSTAEEAEPELVSREVQAGLGLFTGVMVYCTAFGGLFALVFAFAYGRVGNLSPRAVSALLAAAGFVAIHVVPCLKYPANPPSVGLPETIGYRTALFGIMIVTSIAAMVGATILRRRLVTRLGDWSAALIATATYLVAVIAVQFLLPGINEVPEQFPAVVLWQFRIASLGTQLVMWTTIGLLFGALTERAVASGRGFARGHGLKTVLH